MRAIEWCLLAPFYVQVSQGKDITTGSSHPLAVSLAEAVHWQLGLQPLPDGAGQNCPGQSQWQLMHYEGTQKADLFLFLANKLHDIPGEKQWFSSPSQALERPDFQEHGVHKTAAPCQQRIHPAKVSYNCAFHQQSSIFFKRQRE